MTEPSEHSQREAWQILSGLEGLPEDFQVLDADAKFLAMRLDAAIERGRVEMQEPQTAETCKAVPPHPKGCVVLRDLTHKNTGVVLKDFPICLTCEANAQAEAKGRRDALEEIHRLRAELKEASRERDEVRVKCLEIIKGYLGLARGWHGEGHPKPFESCDFPLCKLARELTSNNPGQPLLDRLATLERAVEVAEVLIAQNVSAQDQGVWKEALTAAPKETNHA